MGQKNLQNPSGNTQFFSIFLGIAMCLYGTIPKIMKDSMPSNLFSLMIGGTIGAPNRTSRTKRSWNARHRRFFSHFIDYCVVMCCLHIGGFPVQLRDSQVARKFNTLWSSTTGWWLGPMTWESPQIALSQSVESQRCKGDWNSSPSADDSTLGVVGS